MSGQTLRDFQYPNLAFICRDEKSEVKCKKKGFLYFGENQQENSLESGKECVYWKWTAHREMSVTGQQDFTQGRVHSKSKRLYTVQSL